MFKKVFCIILLLGTTLFMISCTKEDKIIVGSKDFTESLILAELYALGLEQSGYKVERKFGIGGTNTHTAIVSGDIHIYPEYTGTGLITILKEDPLYDPIEVYETVKAKYLDQYKIIWLNQANVNDAQGLVLTKKASKAYGIQTISELQAKASLIRFASQGTFDAREDGLPALEKAYGSFKFKSHQIYDNGLKYQILRSDEADLAVAYTTEGELSSGDFIILEDDLQVWPPYYVTPIIREDLYLSSPDIEAILNHISATLTTEIMIDLNAKVDIDKQEVETVAKEFFSQYILQ